MSKIFYEKVEELRDELWEHHYEICCSDITDCESPPAKCWALLSRVASLGGFFDD